MFSEQLKVLRNSRGLSQRDLCKIFCVSSGAIAMWETGKRQPDLSTLCKLADYFNVTVDYLLGREDKEKRPYNRIKRSYRRYLMSYPLLNRDRL